MDLIYRLIDSRGFTLFTLGLVVALGLFVNVLNQEIDTMKLSEGIYKELACYDQNYLFNYLQELKPPENFKGTEDDWFQVKQELYGKCENGK